MRPTLFNRLRRSPLLLGTVLIGAGVTTGVVAHLGFSRPAPAIAEGAVVGRKPGTAPRPVPQMVEIDPALVPPVAPPLDPPTPAIIAPADWSEEPEAPPSRQPTRGTDADRDDADRAYDRLRAADARLAAAYDRAAEAGASNRDLRALRRDWNRARDDADWDPAGVADAYDEMADDLEDLTRDLLRG